ncbi:hypothetical protein E1A91_D07G208400v1 [Gossypium mustelinum]|uniref:Uncharacterized protein n=1 Tax=Gossypium mustelinum TaxID=34275 RepID=A0A5D2UD36_GOSMU|nr:hypothetical protein E1A91_D07G208400v1 [Gossypium mustelinum]
MNSHSMKNQLNILFPIKIVISPCCVKSTLKKWKKEIFLLSRTFFVKSRLLIQYNKFLFQHGAKRTTYRMGRRSCDAWLNP